jgi:hypothetical protein
VRIRCFTASPADRARPSFELEFRELFKALRDARGERRFDVEFATLTEPKTFIKELRRNTDDVIHIACHGAEHGLCFHSADDCSVTVEPDWIVARFASTKSVKLVLFNACESAELARALVESPDTSVRAAIGYVGKIDEQSLCAFTNAFYTALAEGYSVRRAFEDARDSLDCRQAAARLRLFGEADFPVLFNHVIPPAVLPWLGGFCLGSLIGRIVRWLAAALTLCAAVLFTLSVFSIDRASIAAQDSNLPARSLTAHDEPPERIRELHKTLRAHAQLERGLERILMRQGCAVESGQHSVVVLHRPNRTPALASPSCKDEHSCGCVQRALQTALVHAPRDIGPFSAHYDPRTGRVTVGFL